MQIVHFELLELQASRYAEVQSLFILPQAGPYPSNELPATIWLVNNNYGGNLADLRHVFVNMISYQCNQ